MGLGRPRLRLRLRVGLGSVERSSLQAYEVQAVAGARHSTKHGVPGCAGRAASPPHPGRSRTGRRRRRRRPPSQPAAPGAPPGGGRRVESKCRRCQYAGGVWAWASAGWHPNLPSACKPPAVSQPAAQWHAQCSRSGSAMRAVCAAHLKQQAQLGLGGGGDHVGEHTLLLHNDLEHIGHLRGGGHRGRQAAADAG